MEFNVDTDKVIIHTNKLEKLSKSAFPNAVRGTLNGLAFDVKKNTMPEVAGKTFETRRKNFLKASSRVQMARGFSVNSLESKIGFIPFNGSNQAVQDLEKQEHGGKIGGRAFIATNKARVSRSGKRSVRGANRMGKIKNIVNVSKTRGSSEGQKFIRSVITAGIGGHILTKDTLFRVKSIKNAKGRIKFKLDALYSYKKGRSVSIKATHFMKKATELTMKKADDIYFKEAERQFEKALR